MADHARGQESVHVADPGVQEPDETDRAAAPRRGAPPPGATSPVGMFAHAPALSLVTAIGAWVALLVQKVTLPALSHSTEHDQLLRIGSWGEFGNNLAAVAGIPALILGVHAFVRPNPYVRPGRRTLVGGFTLLLTTLTMWATLFDRTQTTREMVLYGLGAAHVLSVLLVMGALSYCRSPFAFGIVTAVAAAGLFGLLGHVLELLAATRLSLGGGAKWMRGIGEVGYLVALISAASYLLRGAHTRRETLSSFVAFLGFGVLCAAFVLASRTLGEDFSLILYHAQRLRLLLDASPLLYALPLALSAAAALGGLLSRYPEQHQLAVGTLLLVAGGYTPRSPVQLLVMALGACLLARAVIYRDQAGASDNA